MSILSRAGAVAATVLAVSLPAAMPASAEIVISIDKGSQRMSVLVDGVHRYSWAVSTGVGGTPSGSYRPQSLQRFHRSSRYNNAPMPHSIFYDGNYAIHGTTHVGQLGGRASKGCIRLHPANAAVLYALVQRQMGSTRIVVH
jgi:lipoprotein-anchoring transpeptidase ErfK/SrfK